MDVPLSLASIRFHFASGSGLGQPADSVAAAPAVRLPRRFGHDQPPASPLQVRRCRGHQKLSRLGVAGSRSEAQRVAVHQPPVAPAYHKQHPVVANIQRQQPRAICSKLLEEMDHATSARPRHTLPPENRKGQHGRRRHRLTKYVDRLVG